MIHLQTIDRKPRAEPLEGFPFTVPAIKSLERLDLATSVTCFVGENGSGKSTMLEAIALAAGLPVVGAADLARDASLAAQKRLAGALKLTWKKRVHRGFFLRAEDFFGYVKRLQQERVELERRVVDVEAEYAASGRSDWAKGKAMGPALASLADMTRRYGVDLDANSHGQGFLKLFQSRFVPGGLYLLDEPEAALSPQSQLALLAMMLEMVNQDAQFVVATHSPIVLAYPGARIYDFDRTPVTLTEYEDLPHVTLTRAFLADPERYLRRLHPEADRSR